MKRKSGFSLVELMVAVVIASVGILAISMMLMTAYREMGNSRRLKLLAEDMDLASFTIKSVIEESNSGDGIQISDIRSGTNPQEGEKITLSYSEAEQLVWQKEFYKDANKLIMRDAVEGTTEPVINSLGELYFYRDTDLPGTVNIVITVSDTETSMTNRFLVKPRN